MRNLFEGMLRPETIAIVTGTLIAWAGAHLFGVGEIVDILLVGIGVASLGFAVFEGAAELLKFASKALNATSSADLDAAGQHLARAVTLLGVSTVQALLLRGQSRVVVARGQPRVYPRLIMEPTPPPGNQLRITRPATIPGGDAGLTSPYGAITVSRDQSLTEQRTTLYHELVHRYFSPRTGPLRTLRAEMRISGYSRSALLRYLEEALAEGYGQLRIRGLEKALKAYRFPIDFGYVTVARMRAEGLVIGTIALGGVFFHVSVSQGRIPEQQ